MKKIIIFLLFFIVVFSKPSFSFDIFGRDEAASNKYYRKEKAYSDAEEAYLRGDYKSAVTICENIIRFFKDLRKLDSVYYLEGLAYLKLKDFENAKGAFNQALTCNPEGDFMGASQLGLADSFLFEEDFGRASILYQGIIKNSSFKNLQASAYYKLAIISKKLGKPEEVSSYLNKLKNDFPMSFEAQSIREATENLSESNFIQVGSFKEKQNADNVSYKLRESGYDSLVAKVDKNGSIFYRVIVKPIDSENGLEKTVRSLKKEGYPAKICP